MTNPFHASLDDQLRGQKVRAVSNDGRVFEGWVERVHHHDRHVLLRDATLLEGGAALDRGTVMVAHADTIEVLEDEGSIKDVSLDRIQAAPWSAKEFDPAENRQYIADVRRDGWTGSYPVVRTQGSESYEIVEGHKRIWAARQAGLRSHPVEIVDIGDGDAARRFVYDHLPGPQHVGGESRHENWYCDDEIEAAIRTLAEEVGDIALSLDRVQWNVDRLDLDIDTRQSSSIDFPGDSVASSLQSADLGSVTRTEDMTVGPLAGEATGGASWPYTEDSIESDGELRETRRADEDLEDALDDLENGEGDEQAEPTSDDEEPDTDSTEDDEPELDENEEKTIQDPETDEPGAADDDGDEDDEGELLSLEAVDEALSDEGEAIMDVLHKEDEMSGPRLKTLTELGGTAFYNTISDLAQAGIVVTRKDPEDGRRKIYRPSDAYLDVTETDEGDDGDVDDQDDGSLRTCGCGAEFDHTLEFKIHRTEDHGKTQSDLSDLEPGEFEEIVNDAEALSDIQDETGFSSERLLRILSIYGIEGVLGPSDVEISDLNDVEFDGVIDEDTADDRAEEPDQDADVQEPPTGRADGGVAVGQSSTDGPGQRCRNCGSHVTKRYAKVHTPEGEAEKGPRVCPNCEDKIRDGNGVREVRSTRHNGGSA